MADIVFRRLQDGDIDYLAKHMRAADVAECAALGHADMRKAIAGSVDLSVMCWAVTVDKRLACIVGLVPVSLLSDIGIPWLLGTDTLLQNVRPLMRRVPAYIDQMLLAYPHLMNMVHAKNSASVRWLARVGFTLAPAEPFGPMGEPFHRFERTARV